MERSSGRPRTLLCPLGCQSQTHTSGAPSSAQHGHSCWQQQQTGCLLRTLASETVSNPSAEADCGPHPDSTRTGLQKA